jgi:hypothetical protein
MTAETVPAFTTARVAAIYRDEWRRSNGGEMFYTGPFYGDAIPRAVRLERRAMVTHYLPHAFKSDTGPARGYCRICGFPGADAACNPDRVTP